MRYVAVVLLVAVLCIFFLFQVSAFCDVVGKPVTIAAAAIGTGGDYEQKMALATAHIQAAGTLGVDIICLPEEFSGGASEPVPGPTTNALSALAKEYGMYIICPLRESHEDKEYNTAVLIDRNGDIAGIYRKIFVVWFENLHVGEAMVPVFDTDFGRIAILICFDLNFPELWQEAELKGAEIVFWPSAFGGGTPLNSYASIHAYHIVGVGDGDIVDMTGEPVETTNPIGKLHVATLDLDRTLVHKDYMRDKVKRLLEEHAEEIVLERDWHPEGWFMLRAIKPGVRVREVIRRYKIETLREYRQRSREQINARREAGERIAADSEGNPK